MFYRLVSAYTRQFSFPYRGLKYFLKLARWLNIADRTYKKKLPPGFFMYLNPTEHIQQQLFWYGYYEKELGELIRKALRPGDVFLDVGANIGYFSLVAGTMNPELTVVAFEPVKELFASLKDNIQINGIRNIIAVNAALGEVNDEEEIFISGADNRGMSSFRQPENFAGKKEKVKILRTDDWFKSFALPKVDLIKIDTEGSELAVLKGMKGILEQFKPLIIVEINPATLAMFNRSSIDVLTYFDQLSFEAFVILKTGSLQEVTREISQTTNVLFIHKDRKSNYRNLFA